MPDDFDDLYLIAFVATGLLLVLLERMPGIRRRSAGISQRWTTNIVLLLIGSLVSSIALPSGLYAFAQAAPSGVLARSGMPFAIQVLLTFLFVDLYRYWEHRFFHRVLLLWRAHLVHHSDTHVDVTTSQRHHPLESVLATAVMMAVILSCGLPAAGIGLYVLVATVVSLWSHANCRIPESIDRALRSILVTPPVHAVHHSSLHVETDSNYGSVLTLWDRLFGTYVAPGKAAIPYFGLEYFHGGRDAGLGRVLLQPFLYRRGMRYPAREAEDHGAVSPPAAKPRLNAGWRAGLAGGSAGIFLVAAALWPTLVDVAGIWASNEAYQYGWLVLPTLVYLLARERGEDALALVPAPGFAGVLLAAFAAALWVVAALANIDVGRHIALVLALHGVAMAMLGWRAYGKLFPVLALLFFAIPSGDLLQPALRWLTAASIPLVASLAQLPWTMDGFVIHVAGNRYMVVDECSGLAYVTLAMFLGYTFGLVLYRSFLKIAALSVVGALLGVLSNAIRVNAIVLIDWFAGSQMELTAHAGFQWMGLLATLGLLFFVLSRLKAEPRAATAHAPRPAGRKTGVRTLAPIAAGLSVLLIVGAFLAMPHDDFAEPAAGTQTTLPAELAGWILVSRPAGWSVDPIANSRSITATYRRDRQDMRVRMVEMLTADAKLPEAWSSPDRQSGWRRVKADKQSICTQSRCLRFVHSTWRLSKSVEERHVFHSFAIGDFSTDSILAFRAAQAWHRLLRDGHRPRLIALISEATPRQMDTVGAQMALLVKHPD